MGVHPSGCVVRRPGGVSSRPVSGQLVASSGVRPSSGLVSARPGSSRAVSARPSGRVRLVPRPEATLGTRSVQRGSRYDCNGASCMWSAASPDGSVDGRGGLDAGATARVVRRAAGRRPQTWPDCTQAGAAAALDRRADRPGRPAHRAGARRWRLRQSGGASCSATLLHLPRGGRPGLAARLRWVVVVAPGARSGRPAGPPSLPARMGVRPQRGPGVQRVLPVRRRHRCDLQEWWWARQGLNL
jgi:hypothetical protein